MQKIIRLILIVLFVCISFILPKNNLVSEFVIDEDDYRIEIVIEGAIKNQFQKLILTEEKTVKEILEEVNLENDAAIECLNLEKTVIHEEKLYIPYREDVIASLNDSDLDTLKLIKGIGDATALKLIAHREVQPFESIEDIMLVKGIKDKKYQQFRRYLCL